MNNVHWDYWYPITWELKVVLVLFIGIYNISYATTDTIHAGNTVCLQELLYGFQWLVCRHHPGERVPIKTGIKKTHLFHLCMTNKLYDKLQLTKIQSRKVVCNRKSISKRKHRGTGKYNVFENVNTTLWPAGRLYYFWHHYNKKINLILECLCWKYQHVILCQLHCIRY